MQFAPCFYNWTTRSYLLIQMQKDWFFECYDITKSFPYKESYNLVQQIRRSAVSELLNIAEGTTNGEWKSPVPLFSYSLIDLFTYWPFHLLTYSPVELLPFDLRHTTTTTSCEWVCIRCIVYRVGTKPLPRRTKQDILPAGYNRSLEVWKETANSDRWPGWCCALSQRKILRKAGE